MRLFCFLIAILPISLAAQSEFGVQAQLGGGYEYNPFNTGISHPDSSSNAAIRSGAFQYTSLRMSWQQEWDNSELRTALHGQYFYFPGLKAANLFRPGADLKYQFNFSEDASLYTDLRYRAYQTERGVDPTAVLNIPASYRTYDGLLGDAFKPATNSSLQAELHVRNKLFASNRNSQLRYNRLGVRLEWKQRFRTEGKPSGYLYASIDINQRVYLEEELLLEEEFETFPEEEEEFEEEELEPEILSERIWRYQQFDLSYRFRKWDNLQLETGISLLNRTDVLQERLGYRQVQLITKLRYRNDRWSWSWNNSYTYRPYTQFDADPEGEELLLHQYWRTSLTATYQLSEEWQVFGRVSSVKRWRNQADQATTFLPYFNASGRVGIQFKI